MLKRLLRLVFGLFLYALGIVLTINADIGYAPWDVLHIGLHRSLGLSIGTASVLVGLVVVVIALLFKERIGLGTVLNMLLIGVFMDLLFLLDFLPEAAGFLPGLVELVAGLLVIALASFFYIGSGFGAGPRDSLMVLLTRRLKLPVGLIRTGIEASATLCGWLLGGTAGLGTVLASVLIGFFVQLVFSLLRFDPTKVRHESLGESLGRLVPARAAQEGRKP